MFFFAQKVRVDSVGELDNIRQCLTMLDTRFTGSDLEELPSRARHIRSSWDSLLNAVSSTRWKSKGSAADGNIALPRRPKAT